MLQRRVASSEWALETAVEWELESALQLALESARLSARLELESLVESEMESQVESEVGLASDCIGPLAPDQTKCHQRSCTQSSPSQHLPSAHKFVRTFPNTCHKCCRQSTSYTPSALAPGRCCRRRCRLCTPPGPTRKAFRRQAGSAPRLAPHFLCTPTWVYTQSLRDRS